MTHPSQDQDLREGVWYRDGSLLYTLQPHINRLGRVKGWENRSTVRVDGPDAEATLAQIEAALSAPPRPEHTVGVSPTQASDKAGERFIPGFLDEMFARGDRPTYGEPKTSLPEADPNRTMEVKTCLRAAAPTPPVSPDSPDWRDDPSADERWNAGLDYGMTQLCSVLGVDKEAVTWDAATETLDGDVQSVMRGILTIWGGDDWRDVPKPSPDSTAQGDGTLAAFLKGFRALEVTLAQMDADIPDGAPIWVKAGNQKRELATYGQLRALNRAASKTIIAQNDGTPESAPEDEAVILFTEGEWVGEARMIRNEDTGRQVWTWASGQPVHPNNKPLGWLRMPSLAALHPSAPTASEAAAPAGDDRARDRIAEVVQESGGWWKSCSGCHETNEGHETGHYPYSETFQCHVGAGCSECGGLGVVWEHFTDEQFAEMEAELSSTPPVPAGDAQTQEGRR